MQEMFADLHVHIGRSEKGKPIKITAARSLNFANIAKECAERKGIQIVGIIDCASPYVIEDIEEFLKTGEAYEIKDGGIIYKSSWCYPAFNLAKGRSLGFASATADYTPCSDSLSLRIRVSSHLTLPAKATRRFIMQKARRHSLTSSDRL